MRRVLFVAISLVVILPFPVLAATWAEPSCDPSIDPTSCNISAPLNVSSTAQTKTGNLTIDPGTLTIAGALTANAAAFGGATTFSSTVTVSGPGITISAPLSVTGGMTVGATGSSTFNNFVQVTSKFTYSGTNANFTLTADSIDDNEVNNTLTASNFWRNNGSSAPGIDTDAVDLSKWSNAGPAGVNTEVVGVLPAGAITITDKWVDTIGDKMTGTLTMDTAAIVNPAIAITQPATKPGLQITGASGDPAISLSPTGGTADGVDITMGNGTAGNNLDLYASGTAMGHIISAASTSTTAAAFPVVVTASGATKSINVTNGAAAGYGVYATASNATGIGLAGVGGNYGVSGASTTGYGGYFITLAAGGTALYVQAPTSGVGAKGLYVNQTVGYGVYVNTSGAAATSIYAENANTLGSYNVGYFKANGQGSTALYAENASTTAGVTKYGIQATATTPSGIGIQARSDYGMAGKFVSGSGGTGVYIEVSGGGKALDARNGDISTNGSYLGGQFFPSENAGNGVMPNVKPDYSDVLTLTSGYTTTGLTYDGSQVWVTRRGTFPADGILENIDTAQAKLLSDTGVGYSNTTAPVYAPGYISGDYVWVFSTASDSWAYLNRQTGGIITGTSGATDYPNVAAFDGKNMWLGGNNSIMQYSYTGVLFTRVSGIGNISDMIYADGYLWAADNTNNVVRKVDVDTYSSSSIAVGVDPSALVYDGTNVWVANYTSDTLTKISTADDSATSYDISSLGSNPNDIVFDGANIWIGFGNSDGIGYFKVADEAAGKSDQLAGSSISFLTFDGTYVWAAVSGSDNLLKIPTGTGFGNGDPLIQKGVLMYNTSGSVRCLYISGTTVSASSSLTNCQ